MNTPANHPHPLLTPAERLVFEALDGHTQGDHNDGITSVSWVAHWTGLPREVVVDSLTNLASWAQITLTPHSTADGIDFTVRRDCPVQCDGSTHPIPVMPDLRSLTVRRLESGLYRPTEP